MAEEDKLKYRDLIEPDDSIEKLISQLECYYRRQKSYR